MKIVTINEFIEKCVRNYNLHFNVPEDVRIPIGIDDGLKFVQIGSHVYREGEEENLESFIKYFNCKVEDWTIELSDEISKKYDFVRCHDGKYY